jgi:flagellar biosynthesis GTPase FlhF
LKEPKTHEEGMFMTVRYALPCAGLLVFAGAHCASTSKQASESPNPSTQQIASSQQASEEALKRAHESQQQATEQEKKAAEEQARVRKDQEKLRQDQETARAEQAKAQQAQSQAARDAQQATQQTQQQQRAAAAGLALETQQLAAGHQVAAGLVTQVRPDEVVVQPSNGAAMKFRVDDGTKVQIGGQSSSADQIKEGEQARVAYEASSNGPRAVSINVNKAGSEQGMGAGSPAASGTDSTGTSGSSTASPPPPPSDQSQMPSGQTQTQPPQSPSSPSY